MDLIETDNYLWMNIVPPEVALPGEGKVDICLDEMMKNNKVIIIMKNMMMKMNLI
jgi:hypothetical protein